MTNSDRQKRIELAELVTAVKLLLSAVDTRGMDLDTFWCEMETIVDRGNARDDWCGICRGTDLVVSGKMNSDPPDWALIGAAILAGVLSVAIGVGIGEWIVR